MKGLTGIKTLSESLRLSLRQWYRRLRRQSQHEAASAAELLDYEALNAAHRAEELDLISYLRGRLRRVPTWKRGHMVLGHTALALGDVATAYASGHAICALESCVADKGQGQELLALSYIRRGAFDRAIPMLEELVKRQPRRWRLMEELAACYLGTGQHEKATGLLERIPEQRRTGPGTAALQFAHTKSTEGSKT